MKPYRESLVAASAAALLAALGATAFRWPDQPPAPPKAACARQQADDRKPGDDGRAAGNTAREQAREAAREERELRVQIKQVRAQAAADVRAALTEQKLREKSLQKALESDREVRALLAGYRTARELKLDLDLDDMPVREAFRRVFHVAKQEFVIADDVPATPRVSLRASGIRLSTALAFLSESAGVHWSVTTSVTDDSRNDGPTLSGQPSGSVGDPASGSRQDVCCVFRVGRELAVSVPDMAAVNDALRQFQFNWSSTPGGSRTFVFAPGMARTYRLTTAEERATFVCPHCHGQVTTFRERQQPVCPTCGQPFQPGWDFCPNDGTRRPSTTVTWRFCPLCGGPIRVGDPCKTDKAGKDGHDRKRKNDAGDIEMDGDEDRG